MAHYRRPGFVCIGSRPAGVVDGTQALYVGGPPGPVSGDEVADASKTTLEKLRVRRDWARKMGYTAVVESIEEFFTATGEYREIPREKVTLIRERSEDSHRDQFLGVVQGPEGARTMLAFLGLIKPDRKARPENEWPAKVKFKMTYLGGDARGGKTDNHMAYLGSQMKSEMIVECNRASASRTYTCHITKWRGWVVDRFAWEGEKPFGGNSAFFKWMFPGQREMNRLEVDGLAKEFQRSSRSFEIPYSVAPWNAFFKDDLEIETAAEDRRRKIQFTKDEEERNLRAGLRPAPGPAEEILDAMRI